MGADLRRTSNAAEVDGWVRRDFPDAASLAFVLSEPLNICLAHGEGGVIFVWRGPGIYECHCFLEQRGRAALNTVEAMFDVMRREHGARLFWAAIPKASRKVKMFVRLLGWKAAGSADLSYGPCDLFIGE